MKKLAVVLVINLLIVAALVGCTEDGSNGLGYVNEDYGFGFNPPSGWTVYEDLPESNAVTFKSPSEEHVAIIFIGLFGVLEVNETLSNVTDDLIESYENSYENFSLISRNEAVVNSMDAYEFVYTFTEDGQGFKNREVLVENNSKFILMSYTTIISSYYMYLSDFEQSLNSVEIY